MNTEKNMKIVDTHCHLDFPDYKDDLDDVIKKAERAGVSRLIVPGTDVTSSEKAMALSGRYPAVFAAAGIHPHGADKADGEDLSRIRHMAAVCEKVVAIGEIGLDHYKGYSDPVNQERLFTGLLQTAKELDLPVILHNRNADKDMLRILKEAPLFAGGVVHCFSSDLDFLEEVLALGMFVSFTGNITFEKAKGLRDIIKYVPQERLLLETDSPYIAPVPLRGRRNEPANITYLLDVYSDIYKLSVSDIARITTHNANRLFRLGMESAGKIVYAIRDSLYLNITNRCTNRCTFCTRQKSDYVKGHNLRVDREPGADEIIDAMGDISRYKEVVFCGYGEPTLRFEVVKKVASYVKGKNVRVRLTTNGEGSLINLRSIDTELKGLVDKVSVSLNAPDMKRYNDICRSVFGEHTYEDVLDFIKGCILQGIEVEITCLDMLTEDGIEACRRMAENMGASFRLRHLDIVG